MRILTISALTLTLTANAFVCVNDNQCLTKTLTLVKQARKIGACQKDVDAIRALGVSKLQTELKSSPLPAKLESCLVYAKEQKKLDKRAEKLKSKIDATFSTSQAR